MVAYQFLVFHLIYIYIYNLLLLATCAGTRAVFTMAESIQFGTAATYLLWPPYSVVREIEIVKYPQYRGSRLFVPFFRFKLRLS